jgi:hypothetical protein
MLVTHLPLYTKEGVQVPGYLEVDIDSLITTLSRQDDKTWVARVVRPKKRKD